MAKRKKWEDYSEQDILVANIDKYNNDAIVKFYEELEEPRYQYIEYYVIFDAVVKMWNSLGIKQPIRAVDMCGGAGKAAFVLKECSPEAIVKLVDVSDKMLAIADDKAKKSNIRGITPIEQDAFSFLAEEAEYDIIMFSSAIHHFKDPVGLINLAAGRLSENGLIITIADPTTITKSRRYKFFEFLATNSEGKKGKLKAFFKRDNQNLTEELDFDLAEYQTYTGIDDLSLRLDLSGIGLHPLMHIRYPAGEPYMTKIMPYLGLCWAFSLVISKNNLPQYESYKNTLNYEIKSKLPFKFKFMI
ncbi:MAG: methyltransferase domain-containing protein [Syntrophomonadaceae bacterium]|nr:methyltransferase domain-containing protein [Syntrophomonadaceae bacterium]